MQSWKPLVIFSMILLILLVACGGRPLQPSSGPTSIPTLASTFTPAFTQTPASTPTPVPTATSIPPSGPCANVFMPILQDAEWVYQAFDGTNASATRNLSIVKMTVTEVGSPYSKIDILDENAGSTMHLAVRCLESRIEDFPLLVISMLLGDQTDGKFIDSYYVSGVYAPSFETLQQNNWQYSWKTNYVTEGRYLLSYPEFGLSLYILEDTSMVLASEISNEREPVTVAAGTFPQAIKITQTFSLPVNWILGASSSSPTLSVTSTQWYQPYVGLLKASIVVAEVEFTQDQKYPTGGDRSIELVEFHPGEE